MTFKKYDKSVLEAKAEEWGWRGDDALIFVERMLNANLDLSNEDLGDVLGFVKEVKDEKAKNNKDTKIIGRNKVADTLSRNIMPKLREAGCPKGDWKVAQDWLKKLWAWQQLWVLTDPNPDIAVEIIGKPKEAGSGVPDVDDYEPYQVPLGATVTYQIPKAASEYLVLLEKDGNGDIFCLQPSRHKKYKVGEPAATSEVIAIVSPEKPAVDWWEAAASGKGFLPIQPQQIESLMKWVEQKQNNCRLWQFEVEIVESKSEVVAVNN
jgi:hypothetical protein